MNNLPTEILFDILSFCSVDELEVLFVSNKKFYFVLMDKGFWLYKFKCYGLPSYYLNNSIKYKDFILAYHEASADKIQIKNILNSTNCSYCVESRDNIKIEQISVPELEKEKIEKLDKHIKKIEKRFHSWRSFIMKFYHVRST